MLIWRSFPSSLARPIFQGQAMPSIRKNTTTYPKEKSQMYSRAKRVVLPPLSEEERSALQEKAALVSVYEILDAVPDPRGKHGQHVSRLSCSPQQPPLRFTSCSPEAQASDHS